MLEGPSTSTRSVPRTLIAARSSSAAWASRADARTPSTIDEIALTETRIDQRGEAMGGAGP